MGEVNFVAFDADKGAPTASISGSPIDVADFLSLWMKNNEDGMSLAKQLGVDFLHSNTMPDDED
jgi:hypothetical protein